VKTAEQSLGPSNPTPGPEPEQKSPFLAADIAWRCTRITQLGGPPTALICVKPQP